MCLLLFYVLIPQVFLPVLLLVLVTFVSAQKGGAKGAMRGNRGKVRGQGEKGKNSLLFRDPAGEEGGGGGAQGEEEGREELVVGEGTWP